MPRRPVHDCMGGRPGYFYEKAERYCIYEEDISSCKAGWIQLIFINLAGTGKETQQFLWIEEKC